MNSLLNQIIHDIKDIVPLTPERVRQISQLSHEEKMEIITVFNDVTQSLMGFILYEHKSCDLNIKP